MRSRFLRRRLLTSDLVDTLLFADLSGYSAPLEALTSGLLSEGAALVSSPADSVTVRAASASAAVRAAMLLRHYARCRPAWPALRAAVDLGPLAASLAARARPGQILCTRAVVRALKASQFVFRPLGEVRLEDQPVEIFELVDGEPSHLVVVDPVCGRLLDPLKTVHDAVVDGRRVFFCSARCAHAHTSRRATASIALSPEPKRPMSSRCFSSTP